MKKKRATPGSRADIRATLKAHVEARAKRDQYAKQAIELLEAGKVKQGKAAAKQARDWDAKRLALEPNSKSI